MLSVVTPATDRNLLTVAEMRLAAGLSESDASQDAALAVRNAETSAILASACRVTRVGAIPLTLRSETLLETARFHCDQDGFWLSRRPVTSIVSVSHGGEVYVAEAIDIEAETGQIFRLSSDCRAPWRAGLFSVQYVAGWEEVPVELKMAAKRLVSTFYAESQRDPALKRLEIPGVVTREWWVGPKDDPLLPADIMALIAPFVNHAREPSR